MSFEVFPYTNFHEMNLDWLIEKMKELVKEWMDVDKKWEEIRELIENFLDNVEADISAEVKKQLKVMLGNGELEAIITSSLGIVTSVDTCVELKKSTKYQVGQVIVTKGYHKVGDNGGATYYLSDSAFEDTGIFEKTANGLFANMLYNDVISVEQLGVVSNATGDYTTTPASNAVAFNNALSLCKSNSTRKHKFKLVGHGNYYVETSLDFGGTDEAKVSCSDFVTDFSSATIFTDQRLPYLILIQNAQDIEYKFGYLKGDNCNHAIYIQSLKRYDWSQYITLRCAYATGRENSIEITNNDRGGWVNEVHFKGGHYANGIYINCPNSRDEVFVTNMLSGFYFDDVTCEGATGAWFKFKNTVGVHFTNCRQQDVKKYWLQTELNCKNFTLIGNYNKDTFNISSGTDNISIFGSLTVPEHFILKNPVFVKGGWVVEFFGNVVEQGNGVGFFRTYDVSPTVMRFKGDCSKVVLGKEYSDFIGINKFEAHIETDATGIVKDSVGNNVINVSSYAGRFATIYYVGGGTWWVDSPANN